MSRIRIIAAQKIVVIGENSCIAHGDGSKRAISKSKSKKRIATKKNRME